MPKPSLDSFVKTTKSPLDSFVATPTTPEPQAQEIGGLFGDAFRTLVVKPAVRFGQAVGNAIAPALGITPEQAQRANQTPAELVIGNGTRKVTVEPQKALGQGGATQIASDVLKSASYLAPYGKLAGATTNVASKVAGAGTARVLGGATAGAAGGYAQDVAQGLDSGEKGTAFIPGFATLIGGATGGLLEGGGVGLEKLTRSAQNLSKEMQEQTFKLTPAQKTKLGTRLDDIVKFANDNLPAGNPKQRMEYADDLYEHYEEQLQAGLESKTIDPTIIDFKTGKPRVTPTYTINKDTFIKQLQSIKGKYKYDRDAEAIYKQIDSAIETVKNQYKGNEIPVDKLNIFKRSTYKTAFNKAGDKIADYVEHDIGDRARVAIERATKGLEIGGKTVGEFNREYGDLIQLRKILAVAENRPELGFTKRVVSRVIGGLVGHSLGGTAGLIGGELVSEPLANTVFGTASRSAIAKKLSTVKPREVGSVIQRLRP